VHGLDDDVIPYSESVFLAQALSGCRVELYLLQGLQHVDRAFSGLDLWRFWHVLESLLSQRD
jgi:dipeptidyl aminopeptidase/acylaminoacyl peptidase